LIVYAILVYWRFPKRVHVSPTVDRNALIAAAAVFGLSVFIEGVLGRLEPKRRPKLAWILVGLVVVSGLTVVVLVWRRGASGLVVLFAAAPALLLVQEIVSKVHVSESLIAMKREVEEYEDEGPADAEDGDGCPDPPGLVLTGVTSSARTSADDGHTTPPDIAIELGERPRTAD
jgi:hypothetical protein